MKKIVRFWMAGLMIPALMMMNACSDNHHCKKQCKTTSSEESIESTDMPKSGIALGGLGSGSMELRKDGIFYNWQIANNTPRGTGKMFTYEESSNLFFVVRYQEQDREPRMKLLQIPHSDYVAAIPNQLYIFPWISPVKKITYKARFPFVVMTFSDPAMPFDIEMEAFTPFIPHDVKNSTLPGAYFNFTITPKSDKPVDVMLMASYRNLAGYDTPERTNKSAVNKTDAYLNTVATVAGMDTSASSYGDISMASLSGTSTYYTGWEHRHPYYEIVLRGDKLPNVDDTEGRNMTDKKTGKKKAMDRCFNTVAVSAKLTKDAFKHSFVYAWNFPNLYNVDLDSKEGNYYSNYFRSSSEVADYMVKNMNDLTRRSKGFMEDFYASSLPIYALNEINGQLNTFITSTFINKRGDFGILEGMDEDRSCCGVATIDVAQYGSIMLTAMFPELQKNSMRFHKNAQRPNGMILHGLYKDYACAYKPGCSGSCCAPNEVTDRLDLPSQFVTMVIRDFLWTNDKAYLEENWEPIKKAIEYVIRERDRNGDMLPDMEGIMSSYDNFPMYGDASYILGQWNSGIASAIEGAKAMNDTAALTRYTKILETGKKVYDEKLWNGKYFRLYNCSLEKNKGVDEGCLTDQMVGQWVAHISGLGRIIDQEKTRTALKNILDISYKSDFGLRNCSWPADKYWHEVDKDCWVDQGNTCWTGVELAFASFLIYEGMYKEGMAVVKTVDDRYREAGLYFNHLECGGHYFRPMSAWGIVNATLGLGINQQVYSFNPQIEQDDYTLFFASADATAHFIKKEKQVKIKVLSGDWHVKALKLPAVLFGGATPKIEISNVPYNAEIKTVDGFVNITFAQTEVLKEGAVLEIK